MTFPVGGGIAYAYKAFILDARAGWTGPIRTCSRRPASNTLNRWNVGGQVGFLF